LCSLNFLKGSSIVLKTTWYTNPEGKLAAKWRRLSQERIEGTRAELINSADTNRSGGVGTRHRRQPTTAIAALLVGCLPVFCSVQTVGKIV
jgi:hypothetical protein